MGIIVLFITCIVANAIWSLAVRDIYVPYRAEISPVKQLEFIVDNPVAYTLIVANTFRSHGSHVVREFIGQLGWLDTSLPKLLVIFYLMVLVFVSLVDVQKGVRLYCADKCVIGGVVMLSVIGILTSLYLFWTPIGWKVILGIQGRYFIAGHRRKPAV
jgi:uncharacterized membrane protein